MNKGIPSQQGYEGWKQDYQNSDQGDCSFVFMVISTCEL